MLAWLRRYANSPNTLANARREAERLLLWAWDRGKPLSSLTHEDFLNYKLFLADPQPAERWVMQTKQKVGRQDVRWRPFAGKLSDATIRLSMTILNSMMSWLVEAGYLVGNPLALSKSRRKGTQESVSRYLEVDLWDVVKEAIAAMPKETPRDRAFYARARWLFTLLFLGGLRISEVVGNTMGDFFMRSDSQTGEQRWWLNVTGKGGKVRNVTASAEMIAELGEYRRALGLPERPSQGERSPLLFPVAWHADHARGRLPDPLTRSAIHGMVKDVFEDASNRWLAKGKSQEQAEKLKKASAHWLRHTASSRLANHKDVGLHHVRDTLGHSSLSTTSIYVHSEEDARHAAVSGAHKIGW